VAAVNAFIGGSILGAIIVIAILLCIKVIHYKIKEPRHCSARNSTSFSSQPEGQDTKETAVNSYSTPGPVHGQLDNNPCYGICQGNGTQTTYQETELYEEIRKI